MVEASWMTSYTKNLVNPTKRVIAAGGVSLAGVDLAVVADMPSLVAASRKARKES
jgi:hypothetical protein